MLISRSPVSWICHLHAWMNEAGCLLCSHRLILREDCAWSFLWCFLRQHAIEEGLLQFQKRRIRLILSCVADSSFEPPDDVKYFLFRVGLIPIEETVCLRGQCWYEWSILAIIAFHMYLIWPVMREFRDHLLFITIILLLMLIEFEQSIHHKANQRKTLHARPS